MELSTSHHADGPSVWLMPRPKLGGRTILDELFNRFDGSYAGTWKAKFSGPQSIQNWKDACARVFDREGLTLSQVAAGFEAYERLYPTWPPTAQEFANICNPPVDPVAAYHEALSGLEARGKGEQGAWSHPAIFWAASGMRIELASQPGQFMKERWAAALKAQLARGTWEPIPEPRVLLPAPGKSPTSQEDAQRMLAKLGAQGITKTAKSDIDGKRWAKRIMERFERGDRSLKAFQIKEARIALGIKTDNEEES
ncbi:hypothetical protein [Duganella violaceipulchra]|uniref:Uncharacterized protein n=1 Tax=Duganella violaceipulchra TaxID=2849652 RepID=A0AA41L867_9BURK|nr:hypothetical protein [Duganella violaceicalia]MBV6321925.1 hypothetical protein [Duganella violaceicalia]MCP2007081.1 hypothetical protein [Duganella violaceicalia]